MAGKKKLTEEEQKLNIAQPVVTAPAPIVSQDQMDAARQVNMDVAAANQAAEDALQATTPQDIKTIQEKVVETPQTTTTTTTTTEVPQQPAPAVDATRNMLEEGYNQHLNSFYDIAMAKKAEMDAARADDLAQQEAYKKAAAWTGTTEFVSSLANLIGVGSFNAANQSYNNYSKDWMQKAEEARKTRVARSENFRDQLNKINSQIAALKSGKAQSLAEYDIKKKKQDIDQQKADAYTAWQVARQNKIDLENELILAKAEFEKSKTAVNEARVNKLYNDIKSANEKLEFARQDLERKNRQTDSVVKANEALAAYRASKTNSAYDQFE